MVPDRFKYGYQSKKQFLEGLKAFIFLVDTPATFAFLWITLSLFPMHTEALVNTWYDLATLLLASSSSSSAPRAHCYTSLKLDKWFSSISQIKTTSP